MIEYDVRARRASADARCSRLMPQHRRLPSCRHSQCSRSPDSECTTGQPRPDTHSGLAPAATDATGRRGGNDRIPRSLMSLRRVSRQLSPTASPGRHSRLAGPPPPKFTATKAEGQKPRRPAPQSDHHRFGRQSTTTGFCTGSFPKHSQLRSGHKRLVYDPHQRNRQECGRVSYMITRHLLLIVLGAFFGALCGSLGTPAGSSRAPVDVALPGPAHHCGP